MGTYPVLTRAHLDRATPLCLLIIIAGGFQKTARASTVHIIKIALGSMFGPILVETPICKSMFGPLLVETPICKSMFGPLLVETPICKTMFGPILVQTPICKTMFGPILVQTPICKSMFGQILVKTPSVRLCLGHYSWKPPSASLWLGQYSFNPPICKTMFGPILMETPIYNRRCRKKGPTTKPPDPRSLTLMPKPNILRLYRDNGQDNGNYGQIGVIYYGELGTLLKIILLAVPEAYNTQNVKTFPSTPKKPWTVNPQPLHCKP